MDNNKALKYIANIIYEIPASWLELTTHRLDTYNEKLAKTDFLTQFEKLFNDNITEQSIFEQLPTAFDYIRLGHPLSCLLEWVIAKSNKINPYEVISFSSSSMPIMAILRKNSIDGKNTNIFYCDQLPHHFDSEILKDIYGYNFETIKIDDQKQIPLFEGTNILFSQNSNVLDLRLNHHIDFFVNHVNPSGSILLSLKSKNSHYIPEIQHVRRRETIAMTPLECLKVLKSIINNSSQPTHNNLQNINSTTDSIKKITGTNTKALISSSGLSIQYAILMGLIHNAIEVYPEKDIKIIVPPNCYGGTNDQARRVAASLDKVEVVDLPVDDGNNMVSSIDQVLEQIAEENSIPYIIAEIPTNPRVEVPELLKLKEVLSKKRLTKDNDPATEPIFILDQTFCPNVHFLGENDILSTVQAISYVSGSKFPSGGLCTSGYCVANKKAGHLIGKIELHLMLCNNEANDQQIEILAQQLPSMNQRINDAYKNTRELVDYISSTLPEAKINFVSNEIALQGFTPSVFSLDLPTKGNSVEEKEAYKKELNYKLINLMIDSIPEESKHCVSYGQLKGCYWTIPATSTQGTTKEGDKDYIVRVSVAPDMNVELHKKVFDQFVKTI